MTERVRVHRLACAAAAGVLALVTAASAQDGGAAAGKQLFTDQGCYGCHTVGKAGTSIAADLSHVGSKYNETWLRDWLRDPKSQKPRAHMPKIEMTDKDAQALAAYLGSLK